MNRLLILGAGGHGKVVAEAALASQRWQEIAFLDARYPRLQSILNWSVVGCDSSAGSFVSNYSDAFVAIGDNRIRLQKMEQLTTLGFHIPSVVHPNAWVSPSAMIGSGSIVVAGVAVNASATIGRGCIINTGATVDHDVVLSDAVHVSPGAHIGGDTTVGARTWIGIGASVRHRVRIGADVMVGAGAAVVEDVPPGVQVRGVPARIVEGVG